MPDDDDDAMTRMLEARRIRGFQLAVGLALLVVALRMLPLTRNFFAFSLVENYAYDLTFDLADPQPPDNIVIIEIDDRSLQALGRFQAWHRDKYAALLNGPLAQAKLVGIDILFPEPDRHPIRSKNPASPSGTSSDKITADDAFALAMRNHGRVVLAAHWGKQSGDGAANTQLLGKFSYPRNSNELSRPRPGETLILPTPKLARAAAAVGYVNVTPDSDGVYRRFHPFMIGPNSQLFPHFGTAVAASITGTAPEEIVSELPENKMRLSQTGFQATPIDSGGTTLINYCGPTGTVPRMSLVDVMNDPNAAGKLKDKIVLVGVTAPGLYDVRPAPYHQTGRIFYGVETNANIVNALLSGGTVSDVRNSYAWAAFALLLGTLVGVAVWFTGVGFAVIVPLLLLLPVAVISFFAAFHFLHQWIPYGAILYATALPLAVCLPVRLTEERRLVNRQFGVYVSPDVLSQLMSTPDLFRQSQRRSITLLFADVRGSTSLSENIPPEVWLAQLNEYLTQMSHAIFDYDGYLDKFMGDGIMAVWNAFGTQPDEHAELAVRAGVQMLQRLQLLNQRWEQTDERTPFRIGIGIHTGEAVMGNVGSDDRMQYTAIGDVVNTAARIEHLCKDFGVQFIISGDTAGMLEADFPLVQLGETEVRGRSQPVSVYEVTPPSPIQPDREDNQHALLEEEAKTGAQK